MNTFENLKWRSLWLKGKSKVWCCSNVLNGSESESVISKQEVDPMFQVKVSVKVWYQNKRLFQGVPRWSKGAKLRETIGRRGVLPLIIRGPATKSLHRCTPYNINTNYEVFSEFSCCWNKLYKSTSSPNALVADPNFILPLHVSVHPSWAIFLSRLWLLCFHFRSPSWEIALNHYSSPFEDFEVSVITF